MDLRPNCSNCHCAMDMENIRANPEGSGFICRTCLEGKQENKSVSSNTSSLKQPEIFSKKSYLCEDCGYSFERNATFYVADCPMCAKINVNEVIIEQKTVSITETTNN